MKQSSRKHFIFQKPTNSLPARTVTVRALEKNYLPSLHSERDRLFLPARLKGTVGPAPDFPEEYKFGGRVPSSQSTSQIQGSLIAAASYASVHIARRLTFESPAWQNLVEVSAESG